MALSGHPPHGIVREELLDGRLELVETREVSGHGVVIEPALDHLAKPAACVLHVRMQATRQSRFDLLQLGFHLFGNRPAFDGKRPLPRPATDVGEAKKVERFWFILTPFLSVVDGPRAKLQNSRFLRMKFKTELEHTLFEVSHKFFSSSKFCMVVE